MGIDANNNKIIQ